MLFIETNRVYYKENSEITSLLLFGVFLKVRQGFPGLSGNLGRVLSFFRVEALVGNQLVSPCFNVNSCLYVYNYELIFFITASNLNPSNPISDFSFKTRLFHHVATIQHFSF